MTPDPAPSVPTPPRRGTAQALRWWEAPHDLLVCALLTAAIVLVFGQMAGFEFTKYDEPEFLLENPTVLRGLTWDGVRWAVTTGHAANWFPVTWLSHMLDVELFGLSPGAHHLVNVALHGASTLLLFLWLAAATGQRGRSAIVAALFALHPLHVETVAWIAERKGLLAGLFWMITLHAYLRYAEHPGFARYVFVLLSFAFGLMAKPVLVPLPFVLLLVDVWPLRRMRAAWLPMPGARGIPVRSPAWLVLEKAPLVLLAAASSAITFVVQRAGGAMDWAAEMPLGLRLANAAVSYVRYLAKLAWPVDLAIPYPHPGAWSSGAVISSATLLVLVTVGTLVRLRRDAALAVGWLWFLGTLVPVIGLVQVGGQSMADRYTYVPAIGVFVMVAWGITELAENRPRLRPLTLAATAAFLVACTAVSFLQTRHWRNSVALFSRAVAVTQDNAQAHYNLGQALRDEHGRTRDALPHLREAIRINPSYAKAHWALGTALSRLGEHVEAESQLREAARLDPDHFRTRLDFASALLALGDEREALAQLRDAVRLQPDSPLALNNLAWLFATAARPELRNGAEAIALAQRACALTGDRDAGFLATLAVAQAAGGDFAAALRTAREARALSEGQLETTRALSKMIEGFEQGRPYRESSPE